MEQVRCSGAAMYQGAAAAGNDGLKAWAKFGGSTTEVHHPSTLLPLSIRYYYACYVGRHVMEYVVLPSVSYFYERVALRAPLVNGNL